MLVKGGGELKVLYSKIYNWLFNINKMLPVIVHFVLIKESSQ